MLAQLYIMLLNVVFFYDYDMTLLSNQFLWSRKWVQLLSNWGPVLCQAQNAALEAQANTEVAERIKNLEQEVARHKEDSGKAQAEVDRLLEILREMENEKNDKDKKINELERWVETCMFQLLSEIFCKDDRSWCKTWKVWTFSLHHVFKLCPCHCTVVNEC